MSNLSEMKCTPCTGKTKKLTLEEIKSQFSEIDNWELNNNKDMIFKKFVFKNFSNAIKFTNLIGNLAEKEGHHPDISLGWGYCLVMIHTHAIKGLSINDFVLAAKIDQLNQINI